MYAALTEAFRVKRSDYFFFLPFAAGGVSSSDIAAVAGSTLEFEFPGAITGLRAAGLTFELPPAGVAAEAAFASGVITTVGAVVGAVAGLLALAELAGELPHAVARAPAASRVVVNNDRIFILVEQFSFQSWPLRPFFFQQLHL
jgi:hypothetical protein